LAPDVKLTGCYRQVLAPIDLDSVVREIDDARAEEAARRLRQAG
jgi:RIO kinase 1